MVGPNFSVDVVIARYRRRHNGEQVHSVQKLSVTLVGFGSSPVGFFQSIDRLVVQLSRVKFTPIAIVRC